MHRPIPQRSAASAQTIMHIWRTVNTDHRRHEPRRVQTLPLLLMRKGDPEMVSIELSAREREGHAVVALSGELDVAEAASVAASLAAVAASGCVIVDLEGLAYIDSSGLAALVLARQHARGAGFDLLLAAPQQQVLRMLAITRLLDIFAVHSRVDEASARATKLRAG
jgi:anti-sigma B factor antagonist